MTFFPRALAGTPATPGLPIEWEETNCLLCGGRRYKCLTEAPDVSATGQGLWFAVVQCQECGLCFTNPRPSRAAMVQFYPPETYPPHQARPERAGRWFGGWNWLRGGTERKLLARVGQGRLLDFGCGGGSFLQRMDSQGWQVTGLDISATTVCRVRADLGLRVLVGSLPHPELQPESFDVITMWQSLEHVHAPRETLREAHTLLAKGGKLLVAVPNIDSLPYRWFGSDWYGLDLPRHLTHFTPMTLALMLERAGFRVRSLRMVRHPKWLRWSAQHALQRKRGPYWHRWLTSRPAASAAAWYSYLSRQADCVLATVSK